MQVSVYNGETCQIKKTISRFTDVVCKYFEGGHLTKNSVLNVEVIVEIIWCNFQAYSGVFRSDGQLLVAGGEMGLIQVRPCQFNKGHQEDSSF